MKTNKTHRDNGDIYFLNMRVFDRMKQSPPMWVMALLALAALPLGWLAVHVLYVAADIIWEVIYA